MPEDDYDVIVYKILVYLYGVMKRDIVFRKETFDAMISRADIREEYLTDILYMTQAEGLISGAVFVKAWGNDRILTSSVTDISITAAGIRYLKDNSKMAKVGAALEKVPGIVATLIGIVKPT